MARWIELPNKAFINLDLVEGFKAVRGPMSDWAVFAYSSGGTHSVADSLKDEDNAVRIIRTLLKDEQLFVLPTHFPSNPTSI